MIKGKVSTLPIWTQEIADFFMKSPGRGPGVDFCPVIQGRHAATQPRNPTDTWRTFPSSNWNDTGV